MQLDQTPPNLVDTIRMASRSHSTNPAIISLHGTPLTYERLWDQVDRLSAWLRLAGIGREEAVAVVMSEGPETFPVFLAVAAVAVYTPLNIRLTSAELIEHIRRLSVRLMITQDKDADWISECALETGVAVLCVHSSANADDGISFYSPILTLSTRIKRLYAPGTGVLLFTSATTGHSKLVPLSHCQIIRMVESMRRVLPEADTGRVLIITPHYHLHCLLSALIQFFSGGCIIATNGLDVANFERWMTDFRPTNFTANPTLFRAILSQIDDGRGKGIFSSLRFVTSAGSLMPDALVDDLEDRFGVPVINGYGLTEAGRVTMSPLKKELRHSGSVGMCYINGVAVMDEEGRVVDPYVCGEIVLKGDTVIDAYIDEPEANISAFRHGWFHTGDLGYLDPERHLYLVGRLKEIINRGAEKILPYEVEDVLSQHPLVKEAAVFGYAHPTLGEDVGACLVLKAPVSAEGIRSFAAGKLAPFKIPRFILFVDEIPKGQTGKPLRANLAAKFGLSVPPGKEDGVRKACNPVESGIIAIWEDILNTSGIGRNQDFFTAGGDSLLATVMLTRIFEEWGCDISPESLITDGSVSGIANQILQFQKKNPAGTNYEMGGSILKLNRGNIDVPLFLMSLNDGNLLIYRDLIREIGNTAQVFGVRVDIFEQLTNERMERFACETRDKILRIQPAGPYYFAGYSAGGQFAYAVARQFSGAGLEVGGLILIDTFSLKHFTDRWKVWRRKAEYHKAILQPMVFPEKMKYITLKLSKFSHKMGVRVFHLKPKSMSSHSHDTIKERTEGSENSQPYGKKPNMVIPSVRDEITWDLHLKPCGIRTLLLWCNKDRNNERRAAMLRKWKHLLAGKLEIREMPGSHSTIINAPQVAETAKETLEFMCVYSKTRKHE